jgi:hypothetical protein
MEKQKTAVEWLVEQLFGDNEIIGCSDELLQQAKEMEKEQHGKTWDNALDKYEVRAGNYMRAYEDFDEYYNKTFKSE